MYKSGNSGFNASSADRGAVIGRLRSKFGEYENLFNALIIYMNNLKDDALVTFENQANDLHIKCRAVQMNKKLAGKELQGIKPDAYMLVRNGQLIIDFSYHYLLRIVKEKYGKAIDVLMLEKADLAAIQRISVLDKTITMDEEKHTDLLLNSDGFNLSNIAACIVTCTDINTKEKERVYYRIKDMIAAGSSYGGASFRTDSSGSPAVMHKNLMMIRKTAIRMYVRDNFTDLREVDDVDYNEDEYSDNSAATGSVSDVVDNSRVEEFNKRISDADTIESLESVAESIKTAGLTPQERGILAPAFTKKKKSLTDASTKSIDTIITDSEASDEE